MNSCARRDLGIRVSSIARRVTGPALLSLLGVFSFAATCAVAHGQLAVRPEVRVVQGIDEGQRVTLAGNTHPLAKAQNDRGAVAGSAPMQRMILSLTHSDAQEAALTALLAAQQDKNSPNFHKWLTPGDFGAQFGASDADIAKVNAWLSGHGFTVSQIGAGKNYIEFSGTAAQVTTAFGTEIHQYAVNGKVYQANASDPSIPAALAPVVRGLISLHNFPRQMHHRSAGTFQRDNATGKLTRLTTPSKEIGGGTPVAQAVTNLNGAVGQPTGGVKAETTLGPNNNIFGVSPYDFATIYNVLPLWNAGIDGTGQTIAVLEETDIHVDDVRSFRSIFGLPAKDPVFIVNGPDPGVTNTDEEGEAVLDTEWAGAVAKGATIAFVTSASTTATYGTDLSAIYAINNNVAPITSLSYGECETALGATGNAFYVSLWQQGAAQGISHFVSTGDNGSDACDNGVYYGTSGIGVSGFASTPYNTAVGGTDFLGTILSPSTYWSATNNATTQASALSYIPETTWDNNCTNPLYQTSFAGTTYNNYASALVACNALGAYYTNGFLEPVGGSGGYSSYSAKPSWQTGQGVPADGHRDIPDVSLLASNGSVELVSNAGTINYYGSFYLVCQEDTNTNGGSCSTANPFTGIAGTGGTSVSTPAFAGIMALVNQKTNARQGVANYVLYDLFHQQVAAGTACTSAYATTGTGPLTIGAPIMPAAGCVFNDITLGANSAGCKKGATNCTVSGNNTYGLLTTPSTAVPASTEAFLNGVGYDEAVGLGSVNATNLVNSWANITFVPTTTTLSLSSTTFAHGASVNATVAVAPSSGGGGTPTGLIQLDTTTTPVALGPSTLSNGAVTAAYTNFPGGTYSVSAYYAGDATYAPGTSAPITVTVTPENSTVTGLVQLENESTGAISTASTCAFGAQCYLTFTPKGASGKGTPTGTLSILNSGSSFATVPLSNGSVQFSTTGFTPGTYSFTANYSGDASFGASSTTGATALTINKAATSSTLARGATTIAAGAAVTLTGTIQGSTSLANGDALGAAPTGTVSFYSGGTSGTLLGTVGFTSYATNANTDANESIATLTTTGLPFSTSATLSDSITAVYSGDSNYNASTSTAGTVKVTASTKTATTSALTATNTPLSYGTSTTIVDTINYSTGTNTPSGTVTFYVDGVAYGTAVTIVSKIASVTIPTLAGGSHQITAAYAGDTNFVGSTGSLTLSVAPLTTDTLSLTSSATSVSQGTQVNFIGTVGYTASANPTGTITFSVDGVVTSGIAALPFYTGGIGATYSTSALAPGTHTVTAKYSGDTNYAAATATSSASVTVITAPLISLTVNQRSAVVLGAPVTVNATVTPISQGPVPTGSISYAVDGGSSTVVSLSNGAASFTITGLSLLKHTIVVTYSGDTTYTSVVQTLTLNGDVAQSILFPPLANVTFASVQKVALAARTTSGGLVSYAVSGPATLNTSNSTLTITGTGKVTVTATAAATGSFAAATSVIRSFLVQ